MEEHDPAIIHTLRQQIKEEMGDESFSGNYILSNEKFAGDKMVGYKNTPVIAETVFKALEPLDVNVKIIVFLRRQDDFLESTYAQRIYSGSTLTFEEFLKTLSPPISTGMNWSTAMQITLDLPMLSFIVMIKTSYLTKIVSLISSEIL